METRNSVAAIGNQSNPKIDGSSEASRLSQWSRVLFAEVLSFFVPSPAIDNDPLLLNL